MAPFNPALYNKQELRLAPCSKAPPGMAPLMSLVHPARTHRQRIVTSTWRGTTPVSSAFAPTPARAAGCSSATSANTGRRGKRPSPAAAAPAAPVGGDGTVWAIVPAGGASAL